MADSILSSRRGFLKATAATAAGAALPLWALKSAPAIIVSAAERPQALQGLHFGDPANGSAVVWSRSDRPARMLVDWSYDESFANARRVVGPHALAETDFTARQALEGHEAGSDVFVRVAFQSLDNARATSEPVIGRFVVPPDPLAGEGHMLGHARRCSSSTAATPSTPTVRSRRRSSPRTARCGTTSSRPRCPRWPRR